MLGARQSASWGTAAQKLALAVTIVLSALAIFVLSHDVLKKIDAMRVANSDNVQWTLSQLEVEALQFRLALDKAETPADLGAVRQRFDVLYSRIDTVAHGEVYALLRHDPDLGAELRRAQAFMDATAARMDGPDAALLASRAPLQAEADKVYPALRKIALAGLRQFASASDAQRTGVAATLGLLALMTLALVASLTVVSALLARLVSKSSHAALRLQETAAGLKTTISASLDAVLVLDRFGTILEFNGAAENLFGYASAEAVSKRFRELILLESHPAATRARLLPLAAHPLVGAGRVEMCGCRASGAVFPVELSIALAESRGEQRLVSFIRDITERKAAEAELIEARDRALAGEKAKADFLAVMSHEMRTPLNGLLGNLALLHDTRLTKRQAELVGSIEASGRLLLHHANDVLDIAKHDAGRTRIEKEGFQLTRLLNELIAEYAALARENGNSLAVDWRCPPAGAVFGDPVRLKQVLLNYLSNAIKFTRNGSITLRISSLGETGDEELFEFRVIDQGIGMKEADLARVFDEFVTLDSTYSRRTDGSGLGLAIARWMAEAMGGTVGVESRLGLGSAFWAQVPLIRVSQLAPRLEPAVATDNLLLPLDILLVEDNAINREVLKGMLRRDGHRIVEAENGELGVAAAAERRYDLILMDISMPVMDGIAATRAIRAGTGPSRAAPVVAVTAHAMPEELVAFREAGVAECLTKPIDRASLRRALARLATGEEARATPERGQKATALAPAPAAAESQVIDPKQFESLLDSIGPDAGRELLGRFLRDAEAAIDRFEGNRPLAQVLPEVHRVAGAAGMFGAMALKRLLNRVAGAGKAGDEAAARSGLEGGARTVVGDPQEPGGPGQRLGTGWPAALIAGR